ncbi:MAG: hypothetical protein E7638_04215 [Ruminococcaceae bacterium]|nr:hypothetical protein [Oscillospiraceae bacterium]
MITKHDNGTISVKGASYDLLVRGHIVDVIICGTAFASLDIRTAVEKTNDDLSVTPDVEETVPTLHSLESKQGEAMFKWTGKSSLWEKEYTLVCTYTRFRFYVKIKGQGRVDSVNYFSGNMAEKGFGSGYEFSYGFVPNKAFSDSEEDYTFRASVNCRRSNKTNGFMIPPMHMYSFRCEGIGDRLALGLVAEKGEHNFHNLYYNISPLYNLRSGFYLTTDQDGHTYVDGEWTAPYIIGYSATDDYNACRKYSDYYFASGIAEARRNTVYPRFWHGPIVCGWIQQGTHAFKENLRNYAPYCQEWVYEDIVEKCRKNDLHPQALIIDDKWSEEYSNYVVDKERFPDLRAFVDRRHAEGIHTMLWFIMWEAEGWEDKSMWITDDYEHNVLDPSDPRVLENIDKSIERIFSSAEGCYDCDGIKMDFAFMNPKGRGFKTYSGKYGCELLYDYMERIYTKAKEIKPYALINNSACHPYFAHLCDQARLHDYVPQNRRNPEDLSARGKIFSISMPGVLQDTDNSAFVTRRDSMRWQLNQQTVGVPDLYAIDPTPTFDINADDLGAIAEVWREYSAKIDAMYSEEDK